MSITDSTSHESGLQVITYTYKASLREDMEQADLIISHAGKESSLPSPQLKEQLEKAFTELILPLSIQKNMIRLWIDS